MSRQRRGPASPCWKGGRTTTAGGYIELRIGAGIKQLEHIVIAEYTLGHRMPPGAQVHHVDGRRANNVRGNLVICPSNAYHALLHRRQRELDACGDASARKCQFCQQWDSPANMVRLSRETLCHAGCRAADARRRYDEKARATATIDCPQCSGSGHITVQAYPYGEAIPSAFVDVALCGCCDGVGQIKRAEMDVIA